jgi:hypothetical protein
MTLYVLHGMYGSFIVSTRISEIIIMNVLPTLNHQTLPPYHHQHPSGINVN